MDKSEEFKESLLEVLDSQTDLEDAISERLSPKVVKKAPKIPKSSESKFLLIKIAKELESPTKSKPALEQLLFEQDI